MPRPSPACGDQNVTRPLKYNEMRRHTLACAPFTPVFVPAPVLGSGVVLLQEQVFRTLTEDFHPFPNNEAGPEIRFLEKLELFWVQIFFFFFQVLVCRCDFMVLILTGSDVQLIFWCTL